MTSPSTLVRAALVLAVAAQGALAQWWCTCNGYESVNYAVSETCCSQTPGGVWDPQHRPSTCNVGDRQTTFTDCCIAAGLPYQACYPY